ncbi:hypothetical protein YDYSG_68920 [Paenibacillus tyrfis]|uniref:hypothetical protein n=1 Tax=Paenibacillus tyrfis TaxID=1501230 RepID=UPI002491622E|nr:hypothetical protein [Paenibacillus tyrfis]GLI10856.1 hypothetical protein YDYSG_68920 [Paenibacillus tyrfis]
MLDGLRSRLALEETVANQDRSFTGMDPSARMLEIAKARVERAGLSHRISFV